MKVTFVFVTSSRVVDHHAGPLDAELLEALRIVPVAEDHRDALVLKIEGLFQLGGEHEVRVTVFIEQAGEAAGHGAVVRHDDVAFRAGRNLGRSLRPLLGLHVGGVEELDEGEGQKDQQEDDPGHENHDGKQAADIRYGR